MELVPYDQTIAQPSLGNVQAKPLEDYRGGDVLLSALRTENEVVGAYMYAAREQFDPEEGFDILEAIKTNPFAAQYPAQLGRAQSQAELDYITSEIQREQRDKEILATSGASGFIATAVAGLVSPTSLIPGLGPSRGVKGLAEATALAAGSIAVQEAVLYNVQQTRTMEEVVAGVAFGSVLGGLLGGASKYLTPAERASFEADMGSTQGVVSISHSASDGSQVGTRLNTMQRQAVGRKPLTQERLVALDELVMNADRVSTRMDRPDFSTLARYDDAIIKHEAVKIQVEKSEGPVQALARAFNDSVTIHQELEAPFEPDDIVFLSDAGDTVTRTGLKNAIVGEDLEEILDELRDAYPDVNFMTKEEAAKWLEDGAPKRYSDDMDIQMDPYDTKLADGDGGGVDEPPSMRGSGPSGRRLQVPPGIRGKAFTALAKLNPVTRLLMNGVSDAASTWVERIQLPGVKMAKNSNVGPAATDGQAFYRAQVHMSKVVDAIKEIDDAYARHFADGPLPEGELFSAWLQTIKARTGGLPPGKMTFEQFGQASFDTLNTGVKHADENVNRAVEAQKKYYAYVNDTASRYHKERIDIDGEDARPLYKEIEFGEEGLAGAHNYAHHVYNTKAIEDNMQEFLADVAGHSEKILTSQLGKSFARFDAVRGKKRLIQTFLSTDTRTLRARLNKLTQEVDILNGTYARELEYVSAYRKTMKEAGVKGKALEDELENFRQQLDPDFAEDMEYRKDLNREIRILTEPARMTKAQRGKALEKFNEELQEFEDAFKLRWEKKGAVDLDIEAGTANFKNQSSVDAMDIFRKITGNPGRVAGMDILGGARGAELSRGLNLDYNLKKKYLVTDPERVIRTHGHSMFPDIELYRMTGSANGAKIFDEIETDFRNLLDMIGTATHIKGGKLMRIASSEFGETGDYVEISGIGQRARSAILAAYGKENKTGVVKLTPDMLADINHAVNKEGEKVLRDMQTIVSRFRRQRGVTSNPNGFGYRAGRVAMNSAVLLHMGTVAISSLADVARPVMKYGATKVFKQAWAPILTNRDMLRATAAEGRRAGIALDTILHNRASAIFDVGENYSTRQTMAERGIEFLANKIGFVALFDAWTTANKQLALSVVHGELSHAFKQVATGVDDPKALAQLEYVGIDQAMASRIWTQYQGKGSTEFADGHRLPNTEDWTDVDAVMALRTASLQLVDDLIVTPGLDRSSWMDENQAYKMVAQFRSFSFTSTNRILMSGLQEPDMALAQGSMFSLALGALSYYTWAASVGGNSWEKAKAASAEDIIYEAFQRSGLLGVLSEGTRIGEQIPGLNDYAIFGGNASTNQRASSVMGGILGPSYDLGERLVSIAQGLHEPTQSTLHKARTTLVPYQNVFYLRRVLDKIENVLGDAVGLPETRGE